MTLITFQDGKPVMKDGKIGTEQECCCSLCVKCCVLINNRRTCEPGTVGGDWYNAGYEAWGIGGAAGLSPFGCFGQLGEECSIWGTWVAGAGGCDGSGTGFFTVGIAIGGCDPQTGQTPIVVSATQNDAEEGCAPECGWRGRCHIWNGVLVRDGSGRPVSIELDEESKVTSYGGEDCSEQDPCWDSGREPFNPVDYITFDCENPLP